MEQQEQDRSFTTKQWWIGGTAFAIFMAILAYFLTGGHPVTSPGLPKWDAIVFAFVGTEVGVFVFWLAARNAGHKGVPIQ